MNIFSPARPGLKFKPGSVKVPSSSSLSPSPSAFSGFTLLEVVLSITILAIIFTFVFSTYSASISTKDYVESRDEIYHTARTILTRMTTELNSAYLTSNPLMRAVPAQTRSWQVETTGSLRGIFFGEDLRENDRDLDRLIFFNLSHFLYLPLTPEAESARLESENSEVEYFGRVDYEKDITYLIRREDLLFHWPAPAEVGSSYALADDCQALNFRYYHQEKGIGEWLDEWDSTETVRSPSGLPLAVEITITLLDREGRENQFSTLVDIPRAWSRN